ncbi:hypothetical protein DUNSADRAFT_5781 [Dunaliella salina]|uniref:Encoded protein n=1 Tax=Dunaliella salina TaxID=3046 RepID=A0ABQ7H783_DUNSA|nr:hypothetical protein DUNSADRAFT_5781 [Dunaliella salina]|eukprot:KAF5842705.1 hypothetical protein DUNSADRAFT_5781 [Dunaliella salina]
MSTQEVLQVLDLQILCSISLLILREEGQGHSSGMSREDPQTAARSLHLASVSYKLFTLHLFHKYPLQFLLNRLQHRQDQA